MRNIARINNYYNRIQAWKDWNAIATEYPELAKKFAPPPNAGWRKIDKAIAKLREAHNILEDCDDYGYTEMWKDSVR